MLPTAKIIRSTFLATIVSVIFMTSAYSQELRANSPKEKIVLSKVAALPEVQQRAREIRLKSKGKTQITLMVSAQPDINIPYYQVNVNDNAPSYDNYYQFAVDPKTYEIFYYNAKTNRQYSLTEWRKQRNKAYK
ncbi:hypothetical protein [Mucilaginibacter defluvii]